MENKEISSVTVNYKDGTSGTFTSNGRHIQRNRSEDRKKDGVWIWKEHEICFRTGEQKIVTT